MNNKTILALAFAFTTALVLEAAAQTAPAARRGTADVVAAAQKFLDTLDEAQRGKLVFDFKDEAQRKRWSNLPVNSVPRAGLRIGDLTQPQRDAALALLAAAFSPMGYEKVLQIVEADEVLRNQGGGRGRRADPPGRGDRGDPGRGDAAGRGERRGRGGGTNFGRDQYFISFLGQPSAAEPWLMQFGGHHLGINITFAGQEGTLAPSHTGAQPARYEIEGKTVRPLGREVDKAYALMSALDEGQRAKALLGFEIRNLVLGPGRDGQTIQPEGLKATEMTEKQRAMMLDLIGEWTGIMHEAAATAKMEEITKNIAETYFAWSGPTEQGAAAYFRVQGPTVFIEFAPQGMGGNASNHIHTIYRDFTNDYGKKWWKQ
jgi:hypothetical protein